MKQTNKKKLALCRTAVVIYTQGLRCHEHLYMCSGDEERLCQSAISQTLKCYQGNRVTALNFNHKTQKYTVLFLSLASGHALRHCQSTAGMTHFCVLNQISICFPQIAFHLISSPPCCQLAFFLNQCSIQGQGQMCLCFVFRFDLIGFQNF